MIDETVLFCNLCFFFTYTVGSIFSFFVFKEYLEEFLFEHFAKIDYIRV